jgi:hypothetical protein
MTGTNCDLFTHKSSRSYSNHLVFQDPDFRNKLNSADRKAWEEFEDVCSNFLGKKKLENYVAIVEELLSSYCALGCNMSLKTPFPAISLEYFPGKYGSRL